MYKYWAAEILIKMQLQKSRVTETTTVQDFSILEKKRITKTKKDKYGSNIMHHIRTSIR